MLLWIFLYIVQFVDIRVTFWVSSFHGRIEMEGNLIIFCYIRFFKPLWSKIITIRSIIKSSQVFPDRHFQLQHHQQLSSSWTWSTYTSCIWFQQWERHAYSRKGTKPLVIITKTPPWTNITVQSDNLYLLS